MTVVSGDIRKSSLILKESRDKAKFADAIAGFTVAARGATALFNGWFDKFTGDGFLAYWLHPRPATELTFRMIVGGLMGLHASFEESCMPMLRSNVDNLPAGAGLAIGVSTGPGYLTDVGEDATIMGPPVVGACRMCSLGAAGETVLNIDPGAALYEQLVRTPDPAVMIERSTGPTKEYEQEVYRLRPSPEAWERARSLARALGTS